MKNLVSVTVLVVMVGPAGPQTVYQNNDVCYPVFEVNAQTEKTPGARSPEQAEAIATFATTGTGTMVEVAVGLDNGLVNHNMPVARSTSTSDRACRKHKPPGQA